MHCRTFGKDDQVVKAAREVVADAICRSGFVLVAYLNGQELHGDYNNSESWRYPLGDYHVTGVPPEE